MNGFLFIFTFARQPNSISRKKPMPRKPSIFMLFSPNFELKSLFFVVMISSIGCGNYSMESKIKQTLVNLEPYKMEVYQLNDSITYGNSSMKKCWDRVKEHSDYVLALKGRRRRIIDSLSTLIGSGVDSSKIINIRFQRYLILCQAKETELERLKLGLKNQSITSAQIDSSLAGFASLPDTLTRACAFIRRIYMPMYYRRLNACPEYDYQFKRSYERPE